MSAMTAVISPPTNKPRAAAAAERVAVVLEQVPAVVLEQVPAEVAAQVHPAAAAHPGLAAR